MKKMLKVKHSNEIQQEIESFRRKEALLVNSVQPLINEALELSTAADNRLKVLKEYDAFVQEKANKASTKTLQEIVEKEQAADDIMRSLNKQFTILANNILPPEKQQCLGTGHWWVLGAYWGSDLEGP